MKKFTAVILCLLLMFAFCGCWDRKEPESLALINSVIYDLNEQGGYRVILEIHNPAAMGSGGTGGGGSSNQNATLTITGVGESLPEAVKQVSSNLDKFLFAGHNKVRFFTKRFAQKGMYGVIDFFARDFSTDEKSFIVVIKNEDPRIIYQIKTGMSNIVGDYVYNLNENQNKVFSQGVFVTTLEFTQDLVTEGKEPVAGVVEAVPSLDIPAEQPPEGQNTENTMRLDYKGLAAFKGDKFAGFLDAEGARVYNFLLNKVKAAYLSVDAEGSKITANVDKSKASIKARPVGENYEFDISVNLDLILDAIEGDFDLLKPENEKLLKETFENDIKQRVEGVLFKIQTELNSDIVGFGSFVHKQYPKEWKNIKDKWPDMFGGCKFNVKINSAIKLAGGNKQTIQEEATR